MKKVVLWGHKLHTHTHSYIHYGFYKVFKYMNIETYWFDDDDDISSYDLTNTLFITEGQVDKNIPIIPNSYYVLHHVDFNKYLAIPDENKIKLVVTHDTNLYTHLNGIYKVYPYRKNTFYNDDTLSTMWGTDLLPYEILENKKKHK